jgi:hypothetical protein
VIDFNVSVVGRADGPMSDRMTRRGHRTPAVRSPQCTGLIHISLRNYEKSRSRSQRDNTVAAPRNGEVLCADLANVIAPE